MLRLRASLLGAFVLLGTACSVSSGNLAPEDDGASAEKSESTTKAGELPDASASDDAFCAKTPGASRADQVCHRWRCDGRAGVTAATWNGEASSCNAGGLDAEAAVRGLTMLNLHRFLAGVAPAEAEQDWSDSAQQCALMAHANAKLSHTPPKDWQCWSDVGAHTSAISLVANRSAPPAIAAFVEDPGNEATMVHRRWLLSEELAFVGFGSTDRYSCVVVDGRSLDEAAGKPKENRKRASADGEIARGWVAWPPPGAVPIGVFESERLDEVGWTVQSSGEELDEATMTVSEGGKALPGRVVHLTALQGSRSAINFLPDGWTTEAGHSYEVKIAAKKPIAFTVEPVVCD